MKRSKTLQNFLAEAIGTFALVFVGCGAIVSDSQGGSLGLIGICVAFGLVVAAMIYSLGNVSGAHINPAVSIAFWIARQLPATQLPVYISAQLIGALAAAGLLLWLFPGAEQLGSTHPAGSWSQSFLLEIAMTFLLMFIILNLSTGHRNKRLMAGLVIGATITVLALFGGPVSGASLNPARSIAPALVEVNLVDLWIYLTAPVIGAVLAVPCCRWVQGSPCCTEAGCD